MRTRTIVPIGVAVVLLGWGFRDKIPLNEHEEPIVVDNGPIRVTRAGADPFPEDMDTKKWEIHHSGPLKDLHPYSWSQSGGQWTAGPTVSLSFVGDITFATVDPDSTSDTSSFRLRRDQFWELQFVPKVRLRSDFDFANENGALKPATSQYEKHRVVSVKAGGTVICFRESATPGPPRRPSGCENTYAPDAIQIVICVRDDRCPKPSGPPKAIDVPSSPSGQK